MISRGGFGKVYLGYKTSDATKLYAIKVFTNETSIR